MAGGRRAAYFFGSTASLELLRDPRLDDGLAGILIGSPVAGLRPIRALRFWTTSLHIPATRTP